MMPLLRQHRDIMILQKKGPQRCKKLDAVLFKRDNGQYILHRILKVYPDGYWIVGDNCVSGEHVREDQVLAIMTGVVRNGKTIIVTDKAYLAYVHLWCDIYPVRIFVLHCRNAVMRPLYKLKKKLFGECSLFHGENAVFARNCKKK